jgi:hypothetical protein
MPFKNFETELLANLGLALKDLQNILQKNYYQIKGLIIMKKKVFIHIGFWVLMIVSALCKFNFPEEFSHNILFVMAYLANGLLIELIMFYVGYGFAYKFLNSKKRWLYVGWVIIIYLIGWILTPLVNGKIGLIDPVRFLTVVSSSLIDHLVWLVGGIVTRHFFDSGIFLTKPAK